MSLFNTQSLTQEQIAAERVASLLSGSNQTLAAFAESVARGLALIWQPQGTTTAALLAALGTQGKALFNESAAAVSYLWSGAARRAVFLAACENAGLTVTTDANGSPVIAARQPVNIAENGVVTLA